MNLNSLLEKISGYVWCPAVIALCFIVALMYCIVLRFPQIRFMKHMFSTLKGGTDSAQGMTAFQAFTMSLGTRIGVGALAGVATAIAYGGPGSIFWMWIYSVFGACSAFAEAVLGQLNRKKVNGEFRGGPSYYLKKCPGMLKYLAFLSTAAGMIVYGFTGPSTQSYNMASAINNAFGIPVLAMSFIIAIPFVAIVLGGMKRASHTTEILMPFMSIAFFCMTLVILAISYKSIPAAFALIFGSAFSVRSAFGGLMGSAIVWGIKRNIYATEAGMGSGAYAAAAADVKHPVEQGLTQAFSVYCSTVVCTCTALLILVTGKYNVIDGTGNVLYEGLPGAVPGIAYSQAAINTITSGLDIGAWFMGIALFVFSFSVILAQGFFVQNTISAVVPEKRVKLVQLIFIAIQVFGIFFGSNSNSEITWNFADVFNGIMTWSNLIGMLFLVKPVKNALTDYELQLKIGKEPVWDYDKESSNS